MKKLLYVAGEPGSGKTTHVAKPLKKAGLGVILHTDKISNRASKHYGNEQSFPNKWLRWKDEFDDVENYSRLYDAFYQSMIEREGGPLNSVKNLICEGVLSGHPQFRKLLAEILTELGFTPTIIHQVAIDPDWGQLLKNFEKRGRRTDQDESFTKPRSVDYKRRLKEQDELAVFSTSEDCLNAARKFFQTKNG